jgi:hypothetical protein
MLSVLMKHLAKKTRQSALLLLLLALSATGQVRTSVSASGSTSARGGMTPYPASRPAVSLDEALKLPPITLRAKSQPPAAVMADLARQSGLSFFTNPQNLWEQRQFPPVDLDIRDASFWQAMREVSDAVGGLNFQVYDRDIMLMAGGSSLQQGMVSDRSFVYAVITRITRTNVADLTNDVIQRSCSLSMTVYVDARAKLLYYGTARVEAARDENGLEAPINSYSGSQPMTASSWQLSQSFGLNLPPKIGKRLTLLRGYLPATVATESQVAEFAVTPLPAAPAGRGAARGAAPVTQPTTGPTQMAGPWAIQLVECRTVSASRTFQVILTVEPRDKPNTPLPADPSRMVRMLDGKGAALMRQGTSSTVDPGGATRLTLTFIAQRNNGEATDPPARMLVDVPLATRDVALPFEFTDVPIP